MKSQCEGQEGTSRKGSNFAFLIAGLSIGAAFSVFFAPKSGEGTRKWIANKSLDAVDTANGKVRQSRIHIREVMDQGQQRISEAVAAGREAIAKTKAAAS